MCQTDYVCTAWTPAGRCSEPATWTGKLFRCPRHTKKLRRGAHPNLAPKKKPEQQGDHDATREPADREAA